MSSKGNWYVSSTMESFFHSMKVECLHDEYFLTREDAKQTIFDYIEIYYNRERKHSTNQNLSPDNFELNYEKAS